MSKEAWVCHACVVGQVHVYGLGMGSTGDGTEMLN